MSEKQEAEDFDEADEDELEGDEEVDLARITKELDTARRRSASNGVPAWCKLELLAKQLRTAAPTPDF